MTIQEAELARSALAERAASFNQAIELLVDCAARSNSSHAFLEDAVAILGASFESPYAAVEARSGAMVVRRTYDAGAGPPALWESSVQDFLTDTLADSAVRARMFRGNENARRLALLACPLGGESSPVVGAIALVALSDGEAELGHELANLSALAVLTARLAGSLGASQRAADSDAVAASWCKVTEFKSADELARAIADRLRTRDACDQVAVGRVRGRRVHVVAVSGAHEPSRKSAAVRSIESAMEECLDAGRTIVSQGEAAALDGERARASRLHAAWSAHAGGVPVASIPLFARDACIAVLAVRRPAGAGFTSAELARIADLVRPYAAALEWVERAHRGLAAHAIDTLRGGRRSRAAAWTRSVAVLALVLAPVWLATSSMQHEISVPASIAPVDVRNVAAPFDGVLRAVHAQNGDRVQVGNVLCEFDTSSLELELARARNELAAQELAESRALAAGEPFEVKLARTNQRHVRSSIELLDREIASATITAPLDGIVSGPVLSERIGDTVAKGEPLCTISSQGRWLLQLEIPERDIAYVHAGIGGAFAALGGADDVRRLQIVSVVPAAKREHGESVYEATATTDADADWVRPGMSGVARLSLGERSTWWVFTHRAVDWMRMRFWL